MSAVSEIPLEYSKFMVIGDPGGFEVHVTKEIPEEGIELVHISLHAAEAQVPPSLKLSFTYPIIDLHASWSPLSNGYGEAYWRNGLETNYYDGFISKATMYAPVRSYFSYSGENRITYALSDALNPVLVRGGVDEPTACMTCAFVLFQEKAAPLSDYKTTVRIDTRKVSYSKALADMTDWWGAMDEYTPLSVPEAAKLPLYSSWYTFHKELSAQGMEEELLIARDLGFKAVILDDGWQHSGTLGGYHTASDWTPALDKFPDMKSHVAKAHDLGMKYMLWYALPFLGSNSGNRAKFKDKILVLDRKDCDVLDPRYPEVRELLISCAVNNVKDYDIDGFKFDFIDDVPDVSGGAVNDGMDFDSVMAGFDALMVDMTKALRSLKPDILIEFRQHYNGPLMRKYANIMRAKDCANDSFSNHVRTIDIRLMAGNTVVHSDMLMWNYDDTVESAAKQVLYALFSVPQISRKLDKLREDHFQMLKFWLKFWMEHRDVLIEGDFIPLQPEANYPVVISGNKNKRLVALYYANYFQPGKDVPSSLYVVNATAGKDIIMNLEENMGACKLSVFDTCGERVSTSDGDLSAGMHAFDVPESGYLHISKVK